MDVLDDLFGEAAEVNERQNWLTYASELHKLREWGTSVKIFDLLDERKLRKNEVAQMAEVIL